MNRPEWVTNEGEYLRDCREVVRISQGILDGSIGLVRGVRVLFDLQFALRAEEDPDFRMIVAVFSQNDDSFPLGDLQIDRWRPDVEAACRRLIQRYQVETREG